MRRSSRQSLAFTLLELLLVCSIVAVIAGVAYPVFTSSRVAANQARCASNLRQIGTGLLLHAAENNGLLPVTTHTTGNTMIRVNGEWVRTIEESWIYALSDYLGDVDEIRVCPADEPERRERVVELKATSYLLNDQIFDAEQNRYGRLQNIPLPAQTLFACISNRPISRTWDHAHCANWVSWGGLTSDVAADRHRSGSRAADQLKGSANYLYADGHVANIPAREMKAMVDAGTNPGAVPTEP